MKKLLIMVGTIVVLIGIVTFAIVSSKPNQEDIYRYINTEQFQERLDNKEDFVVYVYGENCGFCQQYAPTLEGYLNENNYKIDKIEAQTDVDAYEFLVNELGEDMQGTPVIYVFKKGVLKEYLVGNKERAVLEKFVGRNEEIFRNGNNNV